MFIFLFFFLFLLVTFYQFNARFLNHYYSSFFVSLLNAVEEKRKLKRERNVDKSRQLERSVICLERPARIGNIAKFEIDRKSILLLRIACGKVSRELPLVIFSRVKCYESQIEYVISLPQEYLDVYEKRRRKKISEVKASFMMCTKALREALVNCHERRDTIILTGRCDQWRVWGNLLSSFLCDDCAFQGYGAAVGKDN